jgi:hypothetical protein
MRRVPARLKGVNHADGTGEPQHGDNDHGVSDDKHGEIEQIGEHGEVPFLAGRAMGHIRQNYKARAVPKRASLFRLLT